MKYDESWFSAQTVGSGQFFNNEGNAKKENKGFVVP
jgi:hypothetical protein